ncbi:hypothetical protein Pcinc_037127, partial [Petrolisthes cinctipes]
MLKWTLRNPLDAATPTPPPPDVRYTVRQAEVRLNLKDSNKCWLETQVKVAQVKSTPKILGASIENGEVAESEHGKLDLGKENESIFKKLMSASYQPPEEEKKRKRHHKHIRCNPLDPLRLFSGEVTDSDTGSVYMRLDHTPAALQPRPALPAPTTGPNDPRRKPLVDISNGDYSDLKKHLQHLSASYLHPSSHYYHPPNLHPHHYHHYHHHQHYHNATTTATSTQQLPQYLQPFAAANRVEGNLQRTPLHPSRPDPLGASSSQVTLQDYRHRSRSSSRSRSRSSSVSRTRPIVNSSLLALPPCHLSRGTAEGQSQSMLQEGGGSKVWGGGKGRKVKRPGDTEGEAAEGGRNAATSSSSSSSSQVVLKRHSIADIPSEATSFLRGMWEAQKERRLRSSSHERRREGSRERSSRLRFGRERRRETDREEERRREEGVGVVAVDGGGDNNNSRKNGPSEETLTYSRVERVEGRRASREKQKKKKKKEEPIYEKVGEGSSTTTSGSSLASRQSSKVTSGSSISSKKSYNSYDNAIYMSMRDLRANCRGGADERIEKQQEIVDERLRGAGGGGEGEERNEQEHLYSSLHLRISPDPNKTPVHMRDHLYENMLYLPMTEIKTSLMKRVPTLDRSRPLPEPPNFDDSELDNTCDFTSEPQKDLHKPVAVRISNELIARFGKSPNDRQHPMPQYGLYISTQPSKLPCSGGVDGENADPHQTPSEKPSSSVHRSTGQHVHIDYSEKPYDLPAIPLHNLRPPPPPPPRNARASPSPSPSVSQVKVSKVNKTKGQSKQKSDPHLPVIYENTRQEEDNLTQSAKKRKLKHTMEIEFQLNEEEDDDEEEGVQMRPCERDGSKGGSDTSPRSGNLSSSDNPDSGVSEGITTPLISPLSAPHSPQTPRSDSLLEEPCTPLSLEELHTMKERENGSKRNVKENNISSIRDSTIFSQFSHDVTDPRFLESFLREAYNRKHQGQSSIVSEASIDEIFHHINMLTLQQQQTPSSMSSPNIKFMGPVVEGRDQVEDLAASSKSGYGDLSKMLLSAVGRNLFNESCNNNNNSLYYSNKNNMSTPARESNPRETSSLCRRHSLAGLSDISRRLSCIGFGEETNTWAMDVSDHSDTSGILLKKARSLHSLNSSPGARHQVLDGVVPLKESMEEILKDPEVRLGCGVPTVTPPRPANLSTSVQWWGDEGEGEDVGQQCCEGEEKRGEGERRRNEERKGEGKEWRGEEKGRRKEEREGWREGGQEKEEVCNSPTKGNGRRGGEEVVGEGRRREGEGWSPTKGSGRAGGGGGQTSLLCPSSLSSQPPTHPLRPPHRPVLSSPLTGNPTLALPVMSSGWRAGASCPPSVPLSLPACQDVVAAARANTDVTALTEQWQQDNRQPSHCDNVSVVGDCNTSGGCSGSGLTDRQQRRQEESCYRLQRLLQDWPRHHQPNQDSDHSVSADWSMEAVNDEFSSSDLKDIEGEEGNDAPFDSPVAPRDSPDSHDSVSLCTLDSDLTDGIYLSPRLLEKIKQVSEEKMLARLRRSFRSKKEKRTPATDQPTPTVAPAAPPRVGILMFVDNPMYLSPEVKKEARIVSSGSNNNNNNNVNNNKNKESSVWYVGNPMYTSPADGSAPLSNEARQRAMCEKENQRNSRLAKKVTGQTTSTSTLANRKPLSSIWLQSNPCYESPDVKKPHNNNSNNNNKDCKVTYLKPQNSKPVLQNTKISRSNSLYNHNTRLTTTTNTHLQEATNRGNSEGAYLTPIPVKHTKHFMPRPTVPPPPRPPPEGDPDILDQQKFLDHEYCTIPGDESDSWATQSSSKKSEESPIARRSLEFSCLMKGGSKTSSANRSISSKSLATKGPTTPSRIWRQTGKNQHSTPRKTTYQGTLEKVLLDSAAPLGTRQHRTPRAVKRGRKSTAALSAALASQNGPPSPSSPPPPLPSRPHPSLRQNHHDYLHHYENEPPCVAFENTSDFHHLGDTTRYQLPPDSIYESIHFDSQSTITTVAPNRHRHSSSVCSSTYSTSPRPSSSYPSSRVSRRSRSTGHHNHHHHQQHHHHHGGAKNGGCGSLCDGGQQQQQKGARRGGRNNNTTITTKKVTKKYRARDVLQGK